MAHDDIPGVRGAPGGLGGAKGFRLPLAPIRMIKQKNNGLKAYFNVFSVSKKRASYSFQRYLGLFGCITKAVNTENINLPKRWFQESNILKLPQTNRCNF